jgi:Bacteriophage head to tail connecting protein
VPVELHIDPERQMQRFKALASDRANWMSYWEDISRYCAPRRMGFVGKRTDGDRRNNQIFNPIGINCTQTLAAALHGMLMNPATKWLNIKLADDALDASDQAKQWTNSVSKRIANALASPETSFHTHANQLLEDMAAIGTGVMYVGKKKSGHLFVRSYTIGEVVVADDQYGTIDTVMRDSEYTVRQMVQIWGKEVPGEVKKKWDDGKYDDKYKVVNVCTPRADGYRDFSNKTPQHMPIAICYIMEHDNFVLEESGAEEMPYVVPRWWLATGEVYGRSPAMTALPHIKVANVCTKDVLDAAEKAISPAITVPHEGLIGPVRTSPNSITYLKNKMEIGQMPTSSQLPFASEYLVQLENAIRTTMFVDQVQFVGDFKMTATEVIQRQTERMRLLGPVLGRLENEFLNPLITRAFGIMSREGKLETPPQEIQGAEMRIEYQSPLARAQKSQIAQGFQQFLMLVEPLAKLSPQIAQALLAPIDMARLTPTMFEWFGVDVELLKHEDQMAGDAQQARMQQMMQAAPPLAKAIRDATAGADNVASAGKTSVEATAGAAALNQQGMLPGATAQPPPAQGGQNLAELIGSLAGGARAGGQGGAGNLTDLLKSFQGQPQ